MQKQLRGNRYKEALVEKIENGVAYISLGHGEYALVDEKDLLMVKPYNWRLHKNHTTRAHGVVNLYAISASVLFKKQGRRSILMHRFIMGVWKENGTSSNRQIDHINGNGLDNRRKNLRIVTQSQNNHNRHRGSKGKYPGVSWNNSTGKFRADIKFESKMVCLGKNFDTPDDAFAVVKKAIKKHLEKI